MEQKIPIIATIILMCVEIIYFAILLFRYAKEIEEKWLEILVCIAMILVGFASFAGIVVMSMELVKW